ncbi:MAG TPA: sugar ABC transporter substrate-binding protein [Candidatus Angelobacter sp.]|nr:sugar ABC transporter substrate-binding protein [Candidatus Angelobacter sp.]
MKRLRVLVSLTTIENGYQREQSIAAQDAARKLDIDVEIIYANNDIITQSQQLLDVVQTSPASRPDAIVFEPVSGTGLPRVAEAAVAAGIGWVVLNCDVDYLEQLRKNLNVPAFAVTRDHLEIGRIQGRQFGALLPQGGSVLYIQGPVTSIAAKQRTEGMERTKPANISIKSLRGQWTEESAFVAVSSWLKLSTSRPDVVQVVGCQHDAMAMGARKAFQQHAQHADRSRWLTLPFTGVDGLPNEGQAWVRDGTLTATIVALPNAGLALEMLVSAFRKKTIPPERTMSPPIAYPKIEELGNKKSFRHSGQGR